MDQLRAELEASAAKLREDLQGQLWEYYGALRDPATALKERLDKLEDKFEDLDASEPGAGTKFASNQSSGGPVDREVFETRVSSLATRLGNLEERLAESSERQAQQLEAMSKERAQHFSLLKSRLDRCENSQAELGRHTDALEVSEAQLKVDLEARLKAEIAGQAEKFKASLKEALEKARQREADERASLKESLTQLFTGLGRELAALRQQVNGDLQAVAAKTNKLEEAIHDERAARLSQDEKLDQRLSEEVSTLKAQASSDRIMLESKFEKCEDGLLAETKSRELLADQLRQLSSKTQTELTKLLVNISEERSDRHKQIEDLMAKLALQEEAQASETAKLTVKIAQLDKQIIDSVSAAKQEVLQEIHKGLSEERQQLEVQVKKLHEELSKALEQVQIQIQTQVNQQLLQLQQQIQTQLREQDQQLQQSIHEQLDRTTQHLEKEDQQIRQQLDKAAERWSKALEKTEEQLEKQMQSKEDFLRKQFESSQDKIEKDLKLQEEAEKTDHDKLDKLSQAVAELKAAVAELKVTQVNHGPDLKIQEKFEGEMKGLKEGLDSLKRSMEDFLLKHFESSQARQMSPSQPALYEQIQEPVVSGHAPVVSGHAHAPVVSGHAPGSLLAAATFHQGMLRAGAATPPPPQSPYSMRRSVSLNSLQPGSPIDVNRHMGPLLRPCATGTVLARLGAAPSPPGTPSAPPPAMLQMSPSVPAPVLSQGSCSAPIVVMRQEQAVSAAASFVPPAEVRYDVPQGRLATIPQARGSTPPALMVNCPSAAGLPPISGEYLLVPGERPNGMPLWKLRGAEMWLYCGTNQRWYVGGRDAKDWRFHCQAGFIYSECVANGIMPDQMTGGWARFQGGVFVADSSITVELASQLSSRFGAGV